VIEYFALLEFLPAHGEASAQSNTTRNVKPGGCGASVAFYLPDVMGPERRALTTGTLGDCVVVSSIPLYAQRK
jgi:hypothetical protein